MHLYKMHFAYPESNRDLALFAQRLTKLDDRPVHRIASTKSVRQVRREWCQGQFSGAQLSLAPFRHLFASSYRAVPESETPDLPAGSRPTMDAASRGVYYTHHTHGRDAMGSKELIKLLERAGFKLVGVNGSHHK